ncbi:phosphatase PAP2 family protein [Nocardioides sp. zg-1308]|uniref:phosphatase PAP2 family protein n=1 Tax=Nocardioides sp. zg-1308 TaxID=2736253 RepID=UPI0015530697|nr:phosphatase PAP2 family protein [Nocardioides sp. zg-1308]NPD04889.1 phosphatase PAP2 family protein [Nocardioides sp. zg-1308]
MTQPRIRERDAVSCAAGLAVTALASTVARRHPAPDRWLFALVNDHGEARPFRVLQQLGTPWVLPGTAVVAALAGRRRLALASALALPLEKALEVSIKKVRPAPRPLYVQPTVLRDDAPVEGGSFPSGHAAIAFAAAALVAPDLPSRARPAVLGAAAAAAVVRIGQGAHHPVDAVGGAALGVAVAAGLRSLVGR